MAAHEDPEVIELMGASLARQIPTLTRWGMPDTGLLILMSSCYGQCFFCAHRDVTHMPAEMVTPWERIERWFGEAQGATHLLLGGTEPSSHPRFLDSLRAARDAGFTSVQLMTSGVTLCEPGTADLWRSLGVTEICVPLYAADADTHDAVVRVPGQWDQVTTGLRMARAAGIEVRVHSLVTRRTVHAIAALAAYARDVLDTRLVLSPLREKDQVFSFAPEAVSFAEMLEAIEGVDVSLAGFPACVAPHLPRGAPAVIDLYFRGQRTEFDAVCTDCTLRPRCPGVVGAHLRTFGTELQPHSA